MDSPRFLVTGYPTVEEKGPLSVTALTDTELVVVEILFKTQQICAELAAGRPLDELVAELNPLQKAETRISISQIQSIRWIAGQHDLRIHYLDDNGRLRGKTTYISSESDITDLIRHLEDLVGHRFREHEIPANFWKLVWAEVFGAFASVLSTVYLVGWWDPQALARVRGGWILLWLGPVGCIVGGTAFFVGCLLAAWKKIHPRPVERQWIV